MDTKDNWTRALIAATTVAGAAPSIHNTQPWHWRIQPGVAELHADDARWLGAADPDRRLLTLSCGAALHHACVALAAEGFTAEVWRTNADGSSLFADLLATLTVTGTTPVTPTAMRHMQTVQIRHTDRRPLLDAAVPADAIEAMRTAANACDIGWHTLDRDAVLELAAATSRAQRDQVADVATQAELDAWTGGRSPAGTGVPDTAIPARSPQTTVPARDFGHVGTLDVSTGHDRQAVYAILYASADDPRHWLRGGEALSDVWLAATEHNLALVPLSAAIEELSSRQVLRRLISNLGYPLIAVRLGIADPNLAIPVRTPRLQADETVEVVD
ncbi:MAG TPA: nitroreductase [Micromonosporaceae bacterium]|nr:nitroreductase [Micromonosporaceae bacterium]